MTRRCRRRNAGVLLVTAAAPEAGAASTECSNVGRARDVRTTGTRCAQARKVVKAHLRGDATPLGFTCKRGLIAEGDIFTKCRKDNKRVS